jgi:ABC-type branched-subunit amino acid transport system substrate-binding protein
MNTPSVYKYLMACALSFVTTVTVAAEKQYGPGVTDTEIKLGQTIAYSGPASSLGTIGRTAAAYYRMINDQGGVNGRRINFITLDDGYSPPKAVELARRLVDCSVRLTCRPVRLCNAF